MTARLLALVLGLGLIFLSGDEDRAAVVLGTGTGALIGGDLTDPENNGDPQNNVNYNAVFNADQEASFGAGEAAFNVFDNRVGGGDDKWCCGNTPGGFPHWVQATFPVSYRLTHFTITSSNDTPGRDPRVWQVLGSNDGVNFTPIFTQNNPGASVWTPFGDVRNQVIRFDAGVDFANPASYTTFRLNTDATGMVGGADFAINEIEFFGVASDGTLRSIASGNWDNPGTWTGAPPPVPTNFTDTIVENNWNVTVANPGALAGTVALTSGRLDVNSTLAVTSGVTATGGTLAVGPSGVLTVGGNLDVSSPAVLAMAGGGRVVANGGGTVQSATTSGNSTFDGTGNLKVAGLSDQGIPGTLAKTGTGSLTLDNSTGPIVLGATTLRVDQGVLALAGTSPFGGPSAVTLNGGTLSIEAGTFQNGLRASIFRNTPGTDVPLNLGGSGYQVSGTRIFTGDKPGTVLAMTEDPAMNAVATGQISGFGMFPGFASTDNFVSAFSGRFVPTATGNYSFRWSNDDRGWMWLDANRNGAFDTGEAVGSYAWDSTASVALTAGQRYNFVYMTQEFGGGESNNFWYTPPGGGEVYVNPTAQAGQWQYFIPSGAVSMTGTPINVTANSRLEVTATGTAALGPLTLNNGATLTTTGAPMTFTGISLTGPAGRTVGLANNNNATAPMFNDGGVATTFVKGGAGALLLDNTGGAGAAAATAFRIDGGTLRAQGANPLAGASDVQLNGGTLEIKGVETVLATNALQHRGYHVGQEANGINIHLNGGYLLTPTQGVVQLTTGPGSRGLDFGSDADFQGTGAVTYGDNYSNIFTGYLNVTVPGTYTFRVSRDDDWSAVWLDLNQDGVFRSNTGALATNNGELLAWEDGGTKSVSLAAGKYKFAVGHSEGGGGSTITVQFRSPTMGAEAPIKPADAAQAGLWSIEEVGAINQPGLNIAVTANSGLRMVTDQTATLGALTMNAGTTLSTSGGNTVFQGGLTVSGGAAGRAVTLAADGSRLTIQGYTDGGIPTTLVKAGLGPLTLQNVAAVSGSAFQVNAGTLATSGANPIGSAQSIVLGGGTFEVTGASTPVANALSQRGFDFAPDGPMNLHNNGGLMSMAPAGRTLVNRNVVAAFSDTDFLSTGVVTRWDNFMNLWVGYLNVTTPGSYEFRYAGDDDRGMIWLDLNQDGIFASNTGQLATNNGELLAWEDTGTKTVTLATPGQYMFAVGQGEYTSGSNLNNAYFRAPGMAGQVLISPGNPNQAGYWSTDAAAAVNLGTTDVAVTAGTSGSVLRALTDYDATFRNLSLGANSSLALSGAKMNFASTAFGAGSTLNAATAGAHLGSVTTGGGQSNIGSVSNAVLDGAAVNPIVTAGSYSDQGIANSTMRLFNGGTLVLDNSVPGTVVAGNTTFRVEANSLLRAAPTAPATPVLGAGAPRVTLAGGTLSLEGAPDGSTVSNALSHLGYHGTPERILNLDGSTGIPNRVGSLARVPYNRVRFTDGAAFGGRGLYPQNDAEFIASGAVNQGDNYTNVWLGYLNVTTPGNYEFRIGGDDDRSGIWLDLDRDGVFRSTSGGLETNNGELIAWEDTGTKTVSLGVGQYRVAIVHGEFGGGSNIQAYIRSPTMAAQALIKPADAAQAGLWSFAALGDINAANVPVSVVANSTISALTDGTATFGPLSFETNAVVPTTLTISGGGTVRFPQTDLNAAYAGITAVTSNTVFPGVLNGNGAARTLYVQGGGDVVLEQPGTGLQSTTIEHRGGGGRLIVDGPATVAGATLSLGAPAPNAAGVIASGHLHLTSPDGTAQTYANPIRALAGGTLMAGQATLRDGTTIGSPTGSIILPDLKPTEGAVVQLRDQVQQGYILLPNGVNSPGSLVNNALAHYGYHINNDGAAMDLGNNRGMANQGLPSAFQTFFGKEVFTSGPGDRGLDYNNDQDFIDSGAIGQVDNFTNLWIGRLTVTPAMAGNWNFRINQRDDPAGVWIDLNRNGVFDSTVQGLGTDRGEQLMWDGVNTRTVNLAAGEYMIAFTHREGGGGSGVEMQFQAPGMGALTMIKPSDPAQAGLWSMPVLGGGLDIAQGEIRTLKALNVGTLILQPTGWLNRYTDQAPDRNITVTERLVVGTSLAMTLGEQLTTTGADVTVNAGATLYVNHPVVAKSLNVQGNLVRMGSGAANDVTVTDGLQLASTLNFGGANGSLTTTGAGILVNSTGALSTQSPIVARSLSSAGTVNVPGANVTDLLVNGGTTTLSGNATITGSMKGGGGTLATQGSVTIDASAATGLVAFNSQIRVDSGNLTINVPAAPAALPAGLQGHYDASTLAGVGHGGTVTRWADISGQGHDLDNYVGSPTLVANGLNGQPTVRFYTADGNDSLWSSFNFDPLTQYTVLTVERLTGGDNERVVTSRTRNWLFGHHGGGDARWHAEGWITAQGGNSNTTWDINAGTINNAADPQANFWFNGTQTTTNSTGSGNANYMIGQLQLGAYGTGFAENSNAEIAEILIFNRVLSAAELNAVGSYLETKYGLTAYNYPTTALTRPAVLGDLRLAPATQAAVGGGAVAEFNSIGLTGGLVATGPMTVSGAPSFSSNAAGDTLTVNATVAATKFNLTGSGTVALTQNLSVAAGGSLLSTPTAALQSQNTLTIDAASAAVNLQGGLNVAGGTLTVNVPAVGFTHGGLTAGLIGYWPFDEGTGGTTADISGNGHTGAVNNGTWVGGVAGNALSFNGASTFVNSGAPLMNGLTAFTMSGWVKPTAGGGRVGLYGQNDKVEAGIDGTTNFAIWANGTGQLNSAIPFSLPAADWHHVVYVGDSSGLRIWVDGTQIGSLGGVPNNATSAYNFNIGGGGIWDTAGNWFNGLIDEVGLWNVALTPQNIQTLYQSGLGGGTPNLGNLRLDPGTGLILGGGGTARFGSITAAGGTSIQGNVILAGDLRPGAGPGTLSINGNLTAGPDATYHWETNGTQSDLVAVSGSLTINGGTLKPYLAGLVPNGRYNLLTYGGSLNVGALPSVVPGNSYAELIDPAASSVGADATSVYLDIVTVPTVQWNSSGTTAWNVAGHWTPNTVPNAATAAVVNTSGQVATVTGAMGTQAAKTLIVDGGHARVDLGGTLQVTENAWVEPTGQLTVNGSLKVGSVIGAPPALLNGLMGYWDLDETSGTTAADSSGRGHAGTVFGSAQWQPAGGRFGGAMRFDGATDIRIPYSADFNLSTFTVSGWVNIAQDQGNGGILGTRFGGDTTFDLKVRGSDIHGDIGTGSAWINTGVDITAAQGGDIPLNSWQMVTYVIDDAAKQFQLYLNGTLRNTISYSGTPALMVAGREMRLGNASGTEFLANGLLDDVAVWGRALSAADVLAVYNTGLASTRVGGTLTTAGTTTFGPGATLDIPVIHVIGGTTTGNGTALGADTTLRLSGGTLAGSFVSTNSSAIAGYQAYEIEAGMVSAGLAGPTANLRKSTPGAATLAGAVNLGTVSVEDGALTVAAGPAPFVVSNLDLKGGTTTLARNAQVTGSLLSAGTLVADGTLTIDAATAYVGLGGQLKVTSSQPGPGGHLTVNVPTPTLASAVSQNFDAPGTFYTPRQEGAAPGPTVVNAGAPQNNVMQLVSSVGSQANSIAFDRTLTGPQPGVSASFDMRIGSGADGGAFALLNTANYGISGAGPNSPPWEEPNLAGSFAVGFDVYDNIYEVSLHWNGSTIAATQAYDYRNKGWQKVNLDVQYVSGGANVSVDIAGNSIYSNYFIPGMTPYEARALLAARTGGATTTMEVDNIDVQMGVPMARLGDLRLDPGAQITLGGAGVARFSSAGAANFTVGGGFVLGGAAPNIQSPDANTLVFNGSVDAPRFEMSGPAGATATLTDRLTVASGGTLVVPQGHTLRSQGSVLLDVAQAGVQFKGTLQVAAGTLTLNAPAPVAAPTGATAYWGFDETAGAVALDSSGNGRNGTLVNSPVRVAGGGMIGSALQFNDANTYVAVSRATNGGINIDNQSFSLSIWSKLAPGTAGSDYFFGQGTSNTTDNVLHAGRRDATNQTLAFYADDLNYGNSAVVSDTANWHHWVMTYDSATRAQTIWVDGRSVATRTAGGNFSAGGSTDFWIGQANNGNWFGGLLDEAAVYNRVLNTADIQSLYRAGLQGGYGPARFGNLDMAPATTLDVGGSGAVGFTTINTGHGALVRGDVTVDQRIDLGGLLSVDGDFTMSDGVAYDWGLKLGPRDLVDVSGDLNIEGSFTFRVFGEGGYQIWPTEQVPLVLFDGQLIEEGSVWGPGSALDYTIEIGNPANPDALYLWDISQAGIEYLPLGPAGQGLYLTGFQGIKIPEPSTVVLGALALIGLGAYCWRRRRA